MHAKTKVVELSHRGEIAQPTHAVSVFLLLQQGCVLSIAMRELPASAKLASGKARHNQHMAHEFCESAVHMDWDDVGGIRASERLGTTRAGFWSLCVIPQVAPGAWVQQHVGNAYTASLYMALAQLWEDQGSQLEGRR